MRILLMILLIFVSGISNSQEILVKGTVIDENNWPFPSAQIINLNTGIKVLTDYEGNYSIKAKLGDSLKFIAYEKYQECYTTSLRKVFSKVNIDVKLWDLDVIKNKFCKMKPKELLVFVGKMKFMNSIFDNSPCADNFNSHGIGEYEIIDQIYGDFSVESNSIKFETSEHANIDSFIYNKHKYALLFVEKYCDDKYYLIFHRDIYRTREDKWAIRYYDPKRSWYFNRMDSIENKISDIKFKNASVRVKNIDSAKKYLKPQYYKQRGRKFIPMKGLYVDDYFKLWKDAQKEWNYDN